MNQHITSKSNYKLLFLSSFVLLHSLMVFSQPAGSAVNGKVFDENGNPLQAVTVKVKGTSAGASTTGDGLFHAGYICKGVVYFVVNGTQHYLTDNTSGNLIVQNNITRVFKDFMYFQPIPLNEIVLNPKIKQNAGW